MVNWEDKPQVKKGNIGEAIVEQYLQKRGFVVYKPVGQDAHLCDRFCATPNKKHIIIADVKTKARRTKYPDTGFNISHYEQYKAASKKYNLPIFIYFVDEAKQKIYGNKLTELEKDVFIQHEGKTLKYPMKWEKIIYFPLKLMITVHALTDLECEELKKYSTRNPNYKYNLS